jgi:hypothetical protein
MSVRTALWNPCITVLTRIAPIKKQTIKLCTYAVGWRKQSTTSDPPIFFPLICTGGSISENKQGATWSWPHLYLQSMTKVCETMHSFLYMPTCSDPQFYTHKYLATKKVLGIFSMHASSTFWKATFSFAFIISRRPGSVTRVCDYVAFVSRQRYNRVFFPDEWNWKVVLNYSRAIVSFISL